MLGKCVTVQIPFVFNLWCRFSWRFFSFWEILTMLLCCDTDSLPWKRNTSQNSRLDEEKWLRKSRNAFYPLQRWWRQSIGIDYLEKGKIITGEYYASLLNFLKTAIVKKRSGRSMKKVLFHHGNAPVHSKRLAQQKFNALCFKLFPHTAYSPDSAPSNFHLFPKLEISRWTKI